MAKTAQILSVCFAVYFGSPLHGAEPVSFRRDVMAALSVAGCNDIRCHGAPSGKAGFRLSLWAWDPAADHASLTRDVLGRRTNPLEPDASLILRKALGRVAHQGGPRFAENSREHKILRQWIADGTPDDDSRPLLSSLRVVPASALVPEPGRQQLGVTATFADGTTRDVTNVTVFQSSDPLIASVGRTGLVEFHQPGEVAVLCRYLDRQEAARLIFVRPVASFRWPDPPEHNFIDRHVFTKLKLLQLAPSELCSDAEFVRRVYLDVCGILPPPEEARDFVADAGPDKRARLIDRLLARPEHADLWAVRWLDVLRATRGATIRLEGVQAYHSWLRERIADDTPFNQVVRTLLTAQGHSFKDGPVNFYCVVPQPTDKNDKFHMPNDLAETTAQVFLGVRLRCVKCHNHPYDRWSQDDYLGLAAFFTKVKRDREGEKKKDGIRDQRPWVIGLDAALPELTRSRTGKPVVPKLPRGSTVDVPADKDRREALAQWLTAADNPFFAKTIVNRVWAHLLGRGIVEPVDDVRPSNPSANDELLDALAADLIRNGWQIKPLVRSILMSRTYQLSAIANDSTRQDRKYFSHALARPLPAEVLLDALCTTTEVSEEFPEFPRGTRAVQLPAPDFLKLPVDDYFVTGQHPFLRVFGQPDRHDSCDCGRERDYNHAHALELVAGATLAAKLRQPNNRLGRLLASKATDRAILEELCLVCLSRPPSAATADKWLAYVGQASDRRRAWEDVLATILQSQEFLFQH
jgi:hypothetical protein